MTISKFYNDKSDSEEEDDSDDDDEEEEEEETTEGEEETTEDGDDETAEEGDDDTKDENDEDDDDDDDDDDEDSGDDDDEDDSDEDTEDFEDEHDDDDDDDDEKSDSETPFVDEETDKAAPVDDSEGHRKKLALCLCASEPAPTPPPIRMPVSLPPRTFAPTLAQDDLQPEIILVSTADTTIYREGILAEEAHGTADTMLVQRGEAGNMDLPSAFSLVEFDLSETGTIVDLFDGSAKATLCLEHLPSTEPGRVATYATCQVLPTVDSSIETLTGGNASYVIPDDCEGGVVEFNVSSTDDELCFDVTSALVQPILTTRLRGRKRRQLQSMNSFLFLIDAPQQNVGQEGDRFYTRNAENSEYHPTLTITQNLATVSPSSNMTELPTFDMTEAPINGTVGDFDPCSICADGEILTSPDTVLDVPPELLPDGIPPEEANCGLVDELCSIGFCDPAVCNQLLDFTAVLGPLCGFNKVAFVTHNSHKSKSTAAKTEKFLHIPSNHFCSVEKNDMFPALTAQDPQSSKQATRVLVTGAAGKTGRLVLSKLEKDPRYEPKGLVRSEASAKQLVKNKDVNCPLEHVVIADITSPTFLEDLRPSLEHHGLDKLEAMIICTSAVPRISKLSFAAMLLKIPINFVRRKPLVDFRSMRFKWKHPNGYPEKVDYEGQVNQIELAKQLGISHVVVVSSMGGTDQDNFLNSVGKVKDKKTGKTTGNGDILLWKRRAEKYLVESGLDYTIIHPGGLIDTPGGKEEFVLDVDDQLYKGPNRSTRISREDLADLCVASLSVGKGQKVSFDCITRPIQPTSDNGAIPESINGDLSTTSSPDPPKSAEEALTKFLELSKTANYAL
ncbi:NAD-dependent epimerase/dehydratase [Nitzschia inconspicua]|uniref:NAD-dependent epimerase/dehydratase n=1 Tax=Nitzschia inconspicua TaxID=303405 RepID=A0A9K3K668_9STRA|nr:NAD-dependent epimerase/dehydratase [Nitzschia inconspicua]